MRHRPTSRFAIRPSAAFAAILLAGCCLCKQPNPTITAGAIVPAAVGPLSAGAASVAITLPNGTSLAGFGGAPRRQINFQNTLIAGALLVPGGACVDPTPGTAAVIFEPATGTKDTLGARALVLANPTRKVAIVKVDAIGMSRKLRNDLVAAAAPLQIPSANLMVVATHTHSGPGGVSDQAAWEIAASDCFAQQVYDAVKKAAVTALTQANAALQVAEIGIASTTVTGANKSRATPPGVVDTQLGVIKVATPGGTPIAALFNFAVHGTSYGANNMQFSADCMGAMEDEVETKLPGVVAIFTNGAEGDVAPMHFKDAGVVLEGQIVGGAVQTLWTSMGTQATVDLRGALNDVAMPPPVYNPKGCLPLADGGTTLCDITGSPLGVPLQKSWLSTTLPFQALRINSAVLIAIPGEPVTDIGLELKSYATLRGFVGGAFVLALANDHGGYFATKAQYQAGTYEGTATLYGEDTGSFVVQQAKKVIDQVT